MDAIEPNFQINVDCELEYMEFGNLARKAWDALGINWNPTAMSGETSDNWLEITKNHWHSLAFQDPNNAKWLVLLSLFCNRCVQA
jgi:hypothetical protein